MGYTSKLFDARTLDARTRDYDWGQWLTPSAPPATKPSILPAESASTTPFWGKDGMGTFGLNMGQGILDMYLGMKNYGMAKDEMKQNKAQYRENFANQAKNYNTDLRDRQQARYAANPGIYQSPSDYMAINRFDEQSKI